MSITKARIDEVITLLATRFPKTFFVHETHRRPLKLGIHRDIGAVLGVPSSSCSGIHNRLHGSLHRLVVVDRIDVTEFVRDRLKELRALARSQQRRSAAD